MAVQGAAAAGRESGADPGPEPSRWAAARGGVGGPPRGREAAGGRGGGPGWAQRGRPDRAGPGAGALGSGGLRAGGGVADGQCTRTEEALMLFELRQYHIRPGQQEKWVKCMEEEII